MILIPIRIFKISSFVVYCYIYIYRPVSEDTQSERRRVLMATTVIAEQAHAVRVMEHLGITNDHIHRSGVASSQEIVPFLFPTH